MATFAAENAGNPFFSAYDTPYGAPPFDQIQVEHYMPAFQEGMKRQDKQMEEIASNSAAPTFENTIVALDFSGELLRNVSLVFFSLTESETNDKMNAIAEEITPVLSEHQDNIYLNAKLFSRVKLLHEKKASLNLTREQERLLDDYYKKFVRSGASLNAVDQTRLREINKELSLLTLKFSDNVLNENNSFRLVIDNKADLAGLPKSVIDAAAETAKNAGLAGRWMFTLHIPSLIPFLQYADNRDLREKMYKAYINKGDNDDKNDNKAIVNKLVNFRIERAKLLGYPNHAAYVLDENMAKNPETVMTFLEGIWTRGLAQAKKEVSDMQEMIKAEGKDIKLEAWDWWYYSEKVRMARFNIDESEMKPYFKLENVRQGAFTVANKLYGIQFKKVNNVPVYHPDVEVFEVLDADGSYLGLFYSDYFPRPGKRSGAWMGNFRESYIRNGKEIRPFVYNVGNFTKPTVDAPSLLNEDEVKTLFHEFGHALHGLLTKCNYISSSGTNVSRDFVELPSQIMENWAMHPEVLKLYARHYQTGKMIPDSLIEKIKKAGTFNQGFMTTELVAAALLDMDWHTQTEKQNFDVRAFESAQMDSVGLIDEIAPRYRSTFFNHIFSGDYSAGYYAYLWAEVLDADAFEAFVEKGIFDKTTATSFRKNILERGKSEDPMVLYRRFRGANPNPEALLKRRGL
ncbi:MAG: M3 family metallopeptidase [Bacteroidales bacterium]|nr:M3 family metallopeptidase [Bacteroidales bacterium]MDD3906728.1 M3 family metallopeptidase [Bacteroidales bacterium]MDD4711905.1 M3 family metallopeptidase [Bacteroidales bacterium]